ncbi:MAG: preprotein translocase subunit SecA [Planctomycetota bacterium]|nr:preprotein translocase subunit SecA [Planctomycetota bacterium]
MGVPIFGTIARKIFGTRNQRMVRRYLRIVDQVNAREDAIRALTDAELASRTATLRAAIKKGSTAYEMIPDVFAVAREVMDRAVGIRSTLDPSKKFDATKLSAEGQSIFASLRSQAESIAPAEAVEELRGCMGPVEGWQLVEIPLAYYEAVRAALPYPNPNDPHHGRVPPFRARPFDVQIIGGIVLSEGKIAEMKTGEGKTIVAPLACYLACCDAKSVHVVTVNDYLVQRDRDWTFPFFRALGLTVGAIHPAHMQSAQGKKIAYSCDVVYGTTSEFGFDYLRDNMKLRLEEQVQRSREFAIVDEVDSTLIDEARTPLIISGPAHQNRPRYDLADRLARHLQEKQREWNTAEESVAKTRSRMASLEGEIRNKREKDEVPALQRELAAARKDLPVREIARDAFTQYYEVELDRKQATITNDGIAEAQRHAGMGSFYIGENVDMPHLLEQAIRAHACYQLDRDYVVAPDEDGQTGIVIVDQNTGRKMVGRQWSDGLHQAVEAKESVRIREETQTMATITIQNFFKLYKRLSGMTGTADTEATEFHEIYRLDVVSIPTNLPIQRSDRNDIVFLSGKDKWDEIIEEVCRCHDVGRPVLVGTTSVEKSETLAALLQRRHTIPHDVLNAKQHEREADIIAVAGRLGAVMIATNMAGRGTDIKLLPFSRAELVDHWKRRNLVSKEAQPSMTDEQILDLCWKHMAHVQLKLSKDEISKSTGADMRAKLMRHWVVDKRGIEAEKAAKMSVASLENELDRQGSFHYHRLGLWTDTEGMGGLHIVGTERHESRRIDNQLRGRSGRQGDQGSSRFFLGLDDDLMKMFAGKATLTMLSSFGMKEGDAIESPMLSRAVEKAQRKVEERNFQIRKTILEYDEPMEHQRRAFFGLRQPILEGKGIQKTILQFIDASIGDASTRFLDQYHVPRTVSEWVWEHFGVLVDPERFVGKDREQTLHVIRVDSVEEKWAAIEVALGELMHEDADPSEWDRAQIKSWAAETYGAVVSDALLEAGDAAAVRRYIEDVAKVKALAIDLSPVDQFLVPGFGAGEFSRWFSNKIGQPVDETMLASIKDPAIAATRLREKAREVYAAREYSYPIDFAIEFTNAGMSSDAPAALKRFCEWANARYGLDWSEERLPSNNPQDLRAILLHEAQSWDDARFDQRAREVLAAGSRGEQIAEWFRVKHGVLLRDDEVTECEEHGREWIATRLREIQRGELTNFERWVLLQIFDNAWKEHLHAMDQLRDAVGLRSFSQKDPRIEFKRESARLFNEMMASVRDRLTDIVFKGRLSPQVSRPVEPTPLAEAASNASEGNAGGAATPPAPAPRIAPPPVAIPKSARAGAVGRNERCPCGSGRKFKHCCAPKTE